MPQYATSYSGATFIFYFALKLYNRYVILTNSERVLYEDEELHKQILDRIAARRAQRNNPNLSNGNTQNNNLTLAPINPNYRLDASQYDEPFDLDLTKVPTNDTTQNKEIDYSTITDDPASKNYLEYHIIDVLDDIFQEIA